MFIFIETEFFELNRFLSRQSCAYIKCCEINWLSYNSNFLFQDPALLNPFMNQSSIPAFLPTTAPLVPRALVIHHFSKECSTIAICQKEPLDETVFDTLTTVLNTQTDCTHCFELCFTYSKGLAISPNFNCFHLARDRQFFCLCLSDKM